MRNIIFQGPFSYIFALVFLRLGTEYICGPSQYLRRPLWLQNSFVKVVRMK